MKNALRKDTFREIKNTLGRFISIFAIAAIGVAFFAGVKQSAPIMRYNADKYYDDNNLMDIRIVSTLGLNNNDINELKEIHDIEGIYGTHTMDAITQIGSKELAIKVQAIPTDTGIINSKDYINKPSVIEGRLPEKDNECVIQDGFNINIGDTITLKSGTEADIDETLKEKDYTVVGKVETPYYLSFDIGTTNIGSGKLSGYIMIPENNFKSDVYTEIVLTIKGAKDFNSYDEEYFNYIGPVKDKIEAIGGVRSKERLNEVKTEALSKLQENREEYNKNKITFDSEMTKANNSLKEGKSKLQNSEEELNSKEKEFNSIMASSEEKLKDGEKSLLAAEEEYNKNLSIFNTKKAEAEEQFKALEGQLSNPNLPEDIKKGIKEKLEAGRQEIKGNEAALAQGRESLDLNKENLQNQKKQLQEAKVKGQAEIKSGSTKLQEGKSNLLESEEKFNEKKAEGESALKDALQKLNSAEEDINNIEEPKWYVLDRESHYSYMEYGSAADSIESIANVFPVFFFIVAALVCLTTMTRMVDEQRGNIGTLKALGYSKLSIASKYLVYAFIASVLGSVVGIAIGTTLFPYVIYTSYGLMYKLPDIKLYFDLYLSIKSTLLVVSITGFATLFACYKELIETPSLLMRPRPPKDGKRILLERITPIWKRFSFSQKLTARNILRYKKRFFMTVIGISGCSALVLAGFGIKNSITSVVNVQYGEIIKYDIEASFNDKLTEEDKNNFIVKYKNDSRIEDLTDVGSYNGTIEASKGTKHITIVVPENAQEYKEFLTLRDRKTKADIELDDDGVVITDKLSRDLGVKIGDTIQINNSYNDKSCIVKIAGITERYLEHVVYTTPNYYEKVFNEKANINTIIGKLQDKSYEDALGNDLIADENIKSVKIFTGIKENFESTIESLNIVVIILIVSAGLLAFVVLYNLTNVNISERIREIATIKVLGFYDKEVSSYVYRENIILTIIGAIGGLGLGNILHKFIMVTVEMENVMFGRNIEPLSYLYAFLITMAFSLIVNLAMYPKLKDIPMVESLKSVE